MYKNLRNFVSQQANLNTKYAFSNSKYLFEPTLHKCKKLKLILFHFIYIYKGYLMLDVNMKKMSPFH